MSERNEAVKEVPDRTNEAGSARNDVTENINRLDLFKSDPTRQSRDDNQNNQLPSLSLSDRRINSNRADDKIKVGSDSTQRSFDVPGNGEKSKVFELNLKHGSGQQGHPDAVVRLPENFDPSKPIHLSIYNHGWRSSAHSSFREADLDNQMRNAAPNTILIVPEWQRSPSASNSDQGRFSEPGMFKGMLQEILSKTPGLQGKSLEDIDRIDIISHSAGFNPTESEIYKNGLGDKVKSITLLDSLYSGSGFDRWLKDNISDLSAGKKQFNNIYFGTAGNSEAQAERVKGMLAHAGLPLGALSDDRSHPNKVMSSDELAAHPINFRKSTVSVDKLGGPHMSLPNLYVGSVERSINQFAHRHKESLPANDKAPSFNNTYSPLDGAPHHNNTVPQRLDKPFVMPENIPAIKEKLPATKDIPQSGEGKAPAAKDVPPSQADKAPWEDHLMFRHPGFPSQHLDQADSPYARLLRSLDKK
ncbi:MAG: hypothetical protein K2X81_25760 [Candidatus Obscuribacterales bacterium]|nr:hypothetical protein [Candidatus Obscuribacterales bacterium]